MSSASNNNNTTAKKTVFITGASTGFGRESAIRFAKDGWNVVATMRTPAKETELQKLGIFVAALDATKPETIDAAVAAAVAKFGGIDVLVNNAGIASFGAFTEDPNSLAQAREIFETNFFGAIRVSQAVLPVFRKQKSGKIIYISSIAGIITSPLGGAYHSSKAALNSYVECSAYELALFGIQNKIVMPGGYKTPIFDKVTSVLEPTDASLNAAYKPFADKTNAVFAGLKAVLPGPENVIETIVKAANDQDPKKIHWPIYESADPFGQLVGLREKQGAAAQFGVVLDSVINPAASAEQKQH